MKKILQYVFAIHSSAAFAKMENAPTTVLASNAEPSALEMMCRGQKPFNTMKCQFFQKSIRTRSNIKDVEESLAKWKDSDFEDAKKGLKASCSSKDELRKQLATAIDKAKPYIEVSAKLFADLCSCLNNSKARECIQGYMLKTAELESKICTFAVNSFEVEFKKVASNRWMNSPEPTGLCNVVNAITIETDGKYSWKYTQTRLSSDEDSLCKFELNKPVIYESSRSKELKMGCEYISLELSL